MNFRSCSGEMNRQPYFYHALATGDVELVHKTISNRYPNAPFGMVGFSLGAALLLNYLGENNGDRCQMVQGAAAISPFFDLAQPMPVLNKGFYSKYILRKLKQKVKAKEEILRPIIDVEKTLASRTLTEFDEHETAPLHGFKSAADLYEQASPKQRLAYIHTPTIIIRALDDPFFAPHEIPFNLLSANDAITPLITQYGGHVGFVESYSGQSWAVRHTVNFLANQLKTQYK